MKNLIIATVLTLLASTAFSQNVGDGPELTLQMVFDAADSKDWAAVSRICDPQGEGDGDTQNICNLANASAEEQAEFVEYFITGKIVGEPTVDGDKAKVNFTFGPDGDREETMNLVNRRGVWYLYSF